MVKEKVFEYIILLFFIFSFCIVLLIRVWGKFMFVIFLINVFFDFFKIGYGFGKEDLFL